MEEREERNGSRYMSKTNETMGNGGGEERERGRKKKGERKSETKPRRTWAIAFSDLSRKLRYSTLPILHGLQHPPSDRFENFLVLDWLRFALQPDIPCTNRK